MRLAPRDRAQSKRIRGAAAACSRLGEGYYLIGFDWEPHPAHAFTYDNTKTYIVRNDDRCFRALVKVERRGSRFAATVMQIGGDTTPYSVVVRLHGGNTSTEWYSPHPLDVLELEALQREVK
jgi:hypothetical protein